MEIESEIKKNNIIKGPWKRVANISPQEENQVRDDIEFVEELAEQIVVNAISIFQENGFDVGTDTMKRYIPFLNECIRAVTYKELGYKHILNDLVDKIMIENKLDNNNNTSYHSININEVKKQIEDIW